MKLLIGQKTNESMNDIKGIVKTVKGAKEEIDKMSPLPKKKSPILAAIIGFLFGPIGVGLYFQSWRDFFLCLGVLIFLMFFVVSAPLGWLFSTAYACYRAITSNKNGGHF
jgi:hypothetical protein